MNAEIVENLKRVVAGIPPRYVQMGTWGYEWNCKTFACIGGWLGRDDWFVARGLIIDRANYVPTIVDDRDTWAYGALAQILELPREDALFLFAPTAYEAIGAGAGPAAIEEFFRRLAIVEAKHT